MAHRVMPRTLLVCIDSNFENDHTSEVAGDIARRAHARLHLATVTATDGAFAEVEGRYRLLEIMDDLAARGTEVAGIHVSSGNPASSYARLGQELHADLLLITATDPAADATVRHALCPVLVLRDHETSWPPEHIVIGDDDSLSAHNAEGLAAVIAGLYRSPTLVIEALRPRRRDEEQQALRRERARLRQRTRRLHRWLGEAPQLNVCISDPASALLEAAREVPNQTLVAVGSRELTPLQRQQQTSVSARMLEDAPASVLVAPPPERSLGWIYGNAS